MPAPINAPNAPPITAAIGGPTIGIGTPMMPPPDRSDQ